LVRGAARRAAPDETLVLSPLFCVPKHDGGVRPIVDFRRVNRHIAPPHFVMTSARAVAPLVPRGWWTATLDLSAAYLSVPMASDTERFLGFEFEGQRYACSALMFGLSIAPWAFCRLTGAIWAAARRRGVHVTGFVDDAYIYAPSREELERDMLLVAAIALRCGFAVNLTKVTAPAQRTVFLGILIDARDGVLEVPDARREALRQLLRRALRLARDSRTIAARAMASLAGSLAFVAQVSLAARLVCWALAPLLRWALRHARQRWARASTGFSWEATQLLRLAFKALAHRRGPLVSASVHEAAEPTLFIESDASLTGFGAAIGTTVEGRVLWRQMQGVFEVLEHINVCELRSVLYALQTAVNTLGWRKQHLLVTVDSQVVRAVLGRHGSASNATLRWLARRFWLLAARQELVVSVRYVPSELNYIPDRLSRARHPSADYQIGGVRVLRRICAELHVQHSMLSVDLFASAESHLLDAYVTRYQCEQAFAVDAFTLRWQELPGVVLIVPPPRLIGRVLAKVRDEGARALIIVPAWHGASWAPLFRDVCTTSVVSRVPLCALAGAVEAPSLRDAPALALSRVWAGLSFVTRC